MSDDVFSEAKAVCVQSEEFKMVTLNLLQMRIRILQTQQTKVIWFLSMSLSKFKDRKFRNGKG